MKKILLLLLLLCPLALPVRPFDKLRPSLDTIPTESLGMHGWPTCRVNDGWSAAEGGVSKGTSEHHKTPWTMVVVIESSVDMNVWAMKNIIDMMDGCSDDSINVLVQWHAESDKAWQFHIKDKALFSDNFIQAGKNIEHDIVGAMQWATQNYEAEHYALILWNHGFGILDPTWDEHTNEWFIPEDPAIPHSCPISLPQLTNVHHKLFSRGIMVSRISPGFLSGETTTQRTVLTNDQMVHTLKTISHDMLDGKKIDVLGMDACVMAMLEIGYQIKDYVNFFVGSQDCEMADGYDYQALIKKATQAALTPQEFAQTIVSTFGDYYEPRAQVGTYTQSAIATSLIEEIKANLDDIVDCLLRFAESKEIKRRIHQLRLNDCIQFCQNPMYVDLYGLYEALEKYFSDFKILSADDQDLALLLTIGKNLVSQAVVANATGKASRNAQGISIYFPLTYIDESYKTTLFARDSKWFAFLQWLVE